MTNQSVKVGDSVLVVLDDAPRELYATVTAIDGPFVVCRLIRNGMAVRVLARGVRIA